MQDSSHLSQQALRRSACVVAMAIAQLFAATTNVATVSGSTLLSEGFESFDLAPVDGQNGWYAIYSPDTGVVVQGEAAHSERSVLIEGAAMQEDSGTWLGMYSSPDLFYDPIADNRRYVTVSADIRMVPDSGLSSDLAAVMLYDNAFNFLGWSALSREQDGSVRFWGTSGYNAETGESYDFFVDLPEFDSSRYYSSKMEVDYGTSQISFYLDGAFLGTGPIAPPFEPTFVGVTLSLQSPEPTASNAYFDNISAIASQAVPDGDPNSLFLAAVVGIFFWRTASQKANRSAH